MSSVLSFHGRQELKLPALIGCSPAIETARKQVARYASSDYPVVLIGPTGTGKELLARHLHGRSERAGELVDVNCGALPREMMESLLFGHRKGAFTGAVESTVGFFARADRGTLFLDELASLPLEGQAKLLRVLETKEILPLGESRKRLLDFRLVAAVQSDINVRMERGDFRPDLWHRLAVLCIHLPGLEARREDIPPMAAHFAEAHGCVLTKDAIAMLQARVWRGNVRELRAVIDRVAVIMDGAVITADHLSEGLETHREVSVSLTPAAELLLKVCREHGGNQDAIMAALGISRATLYRRLRESGIVLKSLKVSRRLETP